MVGASRVAFPVSTFSSIAGYVYSVNKHFSGIGIVEWAYSLPKYTRLISPNSNHDKPQGSRLSQVTQRPWTA